MLYDQQLELNAQLRRSLNHTEHAIVELIESLPDSGESQRPFTAQMEPKPLRLILRRHQLVKDGQNVSLAESAPKFEVLQDGDCRSIHQALSE